MEHKNATQEEMKMQKMTVLVNESNERTFDVDSLTDASKVCRDYILGGDLTTHDWTARCGEVRSAAGSVVATVSYNGRIWDILGREINE